MNSDKVICNKANTCKHAAECGGAQPHHTCNECGKCPMDGEARCCAIPDHIKDIINDDSPRTINLPKKSGRTCKPISQAIRNAIRRGQ